MRFPRCGGVLLHPTSLPSPFGSGDMGEGAYHFVDWMVSAGQTVWQMLPLGPVGLANSPYMSLSAFAGSPLLVDLVELKSHNWLTQDDLVAPAFPEHRVDYGAVEAFRMNALHTASRRFTASATTEQKKEFEHFCKTNSAWLEDYALFQAINGVSDRRLWTTWANKSLVRREAAAMEKTKKDLHEEIEFHRFSQWCFTRQWGNLKRYANERGVKLVGDIPIFVAHHSSDVWAHPNAFSLDADGNPTVVAGVPPDYFSKTGQRWGNPLYRWDVMQAQKYAWWVERFRATFNYFDILRIDHFRGFEAYWEIPATEKTAVIGKWVKGPGAELFRAVQRKLGKLPIIAEDLGFITPEVAELREQFEFPGMKILQFAFAAGPDNEFLPHAFAANSVVYSGTHDNDTTRGWFAKATAREKDFVMRYLGTTGNEIQWDLIRLALFSVSDIAIIPFQDILGLGSEGRMNFPGTTDGNWEWRFTWNQVGPENALRLYEMTALSNRCTPDRLHLPPYPSGQALP